MVLYPYGLPPRAEHAELCSRFIVEAGGDISRVIDGPFPSIERFIALAERLPVLKSETQRAIVVLTRTNPVAITVVAARRRIQASVPALARAVWVLFVDPVEDPFCFDTLRNLGTLDAEEVEVPIWRDPDGHEYVVLSSEFESTTRVRTAGRVLLDD